MLDVGLYQLDQQAACQRYRQKPVIANAITRGLNRLASVLTLPSLQTVSLAA